MKAYFLLFLKYYNNYSYSYMGKNYEKIFNDEDEIIIP